MMPFRKILRLVCSIAATLCLSVGYMALGDWLALLVWLTLAVWLLAWRKSSRGLSIFALLLDVSLSAGGLVSGARPELMLISAALALASWDLSLWNMALAGNDRPDSQSSLAYSHITSLALAVGLGLLAALAGRLLRFQLPFVVMVLLVLLVLFGIDRLWRALGG